MIKPGDVVTALLPGARNQAPSGHRYFDSRLKRRAPDALLTIITSRVEDADTAYACVLFNWREAGLKTAYAMRSYLFTVEASEVKAIGYLSDAGWNDVQARLRLALEF